MSKKQRLVVLGCSFTFGHGLPDCTRGEGLRVKPSQLGWPAILGKMLDMEVVNLGFPGASNLEILYYLLNFDFKENDIVVIMWSLPFRDLYFKTRMFESKPFRQLKVWLNHPRWKKVWNPDSGEEDYAVRSWIYMHHASLFLKSKNLIHLHYPAAPHELVDHKPSYINIPELSLDGFIVVDKAEDQLHPGLESNKLTADNIYKILSDKLNV